MHAVAVHFALGTWLFVAQGSIQQDERKPDAAAAIEAARIKAAAENRRVLIVWGTGESEPCRNLDTSFEKDEDLSRKLRYEYDVVRVDLGQNPELAKRYGAGADEVPLMTVLDAKGSVLANQPATALAGDPKKLLDFLTRHQAPYEKAEDVRARALREASAAGKKLLLTFGAPW